LTKKWIENDVDESDQTLIKISLKN
jgi:hypothetical protein